MRREKRGCAGVCMAVSWGPGCRLGVIVSTEDEKRHCATLSTLSLEVGRLKWKLLEQTSKFQRSKRALRRFLVLECVWCGQEEKLRHAGRCFQIEPETWAKIIAITLFG